MMGSVQLFLIYRPCCGVIRRSFCHGSCRYAIWFSQDYNDESDPPSNAVPCVTTNVTRHLNKTFALLMRAEMTPKTINKPITKLGVLYAFHSQNLALFLSHQNGLQRKIQQNIIIPSDSWSPMWTSPKIFHYQNSVCFPPLPHSIHRSTNIVIFRYLLP